jgi:hypothetical protein
MMTQSSKVTRPWAQVNEVAQKVVAAFAPYCERIEVAGSLRRGKAEVGDIEIVAIPRMEERVVRQATLLDPAQTAPHSALWGCLDGWLAEGRICHTPSKAWGDLYRRFLFTSAKGETYQVDVFTCTTENWGNTFLIRTGSGDFSQFMVTPQSKGGALPDGFAHSGGWLYQHGRPVPVREEAEWFALCGLPFVPPAQRGQFGLPSVVEPTDVLPEFALSIKQPWVEAILQGHKRVENRDWAPPAKIIGKRIALHASKKWDDKEGVAFCQNILERGGLPAVAEDVVTGAIVGTAVVAGYIRLLASGEVERVGDVAWYEVGGDPWLVGEYGWVLADVQRLAKPIPARGMLGLWETAKGIRQGQVNNV